MTTDVEPDVASLELHEWLESIEYVISQGDPERTRRILAALESRAAESGVRLPFSANTPYVNTFPVELQEPYPGDRDLERRIKNIVRWNALAMVVRANRADGSIGGHISTYASSATLYEVGFNHFFRNRNGSHEAISSSSRATRRPASTRGPTWKAASPRSSSRTSATR